ncbi:meiotic recombination protein REC114-like isoform X2 [Apostichopus japonicus]|uniref:meiotic recombination protein REC114-like isoform X2 n=1 Tax=Stichopus japonicus TaxID=307972 RepID=UPI003AB8D2D2
MKLSWSLKRYARFMLDRRSFVARKDSDEQVQNGVWKENLLLTNSKDKFKILIKGDSMLFAVKLKNDVRRFRIMFAESESKSVSAEHFCIECTTAVRKHCPVRVVKQDGRTEHDSDTVTSQSSALDAAPSSQQDIEGEVSLSKMVELLTSGDLTRLPCAYQGDLCTAPSTIEKDSLGRLVKWCLLDPEFPAFVQQVETQFKKISQEC